MDLLRRIAIDVAESPPGFLRAHRMAFLATIWIALATLASAAEQAVQSEISDRDLAPGVETRLLQPAWNMPQAAASQVDRPLEVPGLLQPGFIAPVAKNAPRAQPSRKSTPPPKQEKLDFPAIVPGESPPGDQPAVVQAPSEAPSLWQQFSGTNGAQAPTGTAAPTAAPRQTAYVGQHPTQVIPKGDVRGQLESLAGQLFSTTAPSGATTNNPAGSSQSLAGDRSGQTRNNSNNQAMGRTSATTQSWQPAATSKSSWTSGLVQQLAPTSDAAPSQPTTAESAKSISVQMNHQARGRQETSGAPNGTLPPGSIAPPNPAAFAERALGNAEQRGSLSALWRPFAMTQDGTMPSDGKPAQTPGTAVASLAPASNELGSGPTLEHTLENSIFLRPFLMTEAKPNAADGGVTNDIAARNPSSSLESRLRSSTLMRQLALSTSEELDKPIDALVESPLRSEQAAWEEGWTVQTPSMTDPVTMAFDSNAPIGAAQTDAQLVAFMQEALPEPADLDSLSGNRPEPDVAAGNAGGANGENKKADSLAEADQLGTEPEDNTLQFLRTATVLLKPGDSQVDIGITYLFTENQFPILLADDMGNIIGVDEVDFRVRELAVPFEYRVGLLKRVQGFIGASVGWANTEVSLNNFEAYENDGGFGDVNFGITAQLLDATANCPYVIATVQATAPTGGDPFDLVGLLAPSAPGLGQGFWSIAENLLFIQPYDPVVLFYGVGMEQFFSEEYRGIEFEPGMQYNYIFGVGFAVNERVTLSSRFFGAYVEELKADGVRLFNTNLEPMSMRFAATISKPCDRIVEPFVEFGLTDQSISSFFGCTWTY